MQRKGLVHTPRSALAFQDILLGIMAILTLVYTAPAKAAEKIRTAVDLSTAIVQVAKRNIPAVVHIQVTGQQEAAVPTLPFENDPFFRYFFGVKGGPSDRAGLKKGDMINSVQGNEILNAASFRNEVAIMSVGTDAKVTFLKDGKKLDTALRVGSTQEAGKVSALSVRERLGVEVRPLNQKEIKKYVSTEARA